MGSKPRKSLGNHNAENSEHKGPMTREELAEVEDESKDGAAARLCWTSQTLGGRWGRTLSPGGCTEAA